MSRDKSVTKEQYNSNSRSKAIRDVSITILDDIDTLLYEEPEDKQYYTAHIEALCGQLIDMGIVSEMHVGKPPETFHDPVICAEYCAGQLLTSLGRHIVSAQDALPIIQEFRVAQIGDVSLVDLPAEKPRPMVDFMVMQSVRNMLRIFLDARR